MKQTVMFSCQVCGETVFTDSEIAETWKTSPPICCSEFMVCEEEEEEEEE